MSPALFYFFLRLNNLHIPFPPLINIAIATMKSDNRNTIIPIAKPPVRNANIVAKIAIVNNNIFIHFLSIKGSVFNAKKKKEEH